MNVLIAAADKWHTSIMVIIDRWLSWEPILHRDAIVDLLTAWHHSPLEIVFVGKYSELEIKPSIICFPFVFNISN